MNHLKNLVYALAVAAVFSAHAGSYEDFFIAIKNDNASNLAGLLERGFDVNTRDPKGQPGLTMALQQGSSKTVKTLIDRPGIDINALNSAGESPLMMAAQYGSENSVDLLLARGADVNRKNQVGLRAVDFAKLSGREPLVKKLGRP